MRTSGVVIASCAVSVVLTIAAMRACDHKSGPSAARRAPIGRDGPVTAGPRVGVDAPLDPPAPANGSGEVLRARRDLSRCQRALAAKATLDERFDVASVDVDGTNLVREQLRALPFGGAVLESLECHDRVCLARVTGAASIDEASDDYWLRAFQATRGELFSQMRVRTRMLDIDTRVTDLMFERPTADDALPVLASVLAQVEARIDAGIPGCEHGRAAVELESQAGQLVPKVVGSECLRPVVDEAVAGADVIGRSDAMLSRSFRW